MCFCMNDRVDTMANCPLNTLVGFSPFRPETINVIRSLTFCPAVLTIASMQCFVSATFGRDDSFANNWPNFRGPAFNGSSSTANPPAEWSETKNVKWKIELPGPGNNSSPIAWDDRVYILTAIPQTTGRTTTQPQGQRKRGGRRRSVPLVPTKFLTICYDRDNGKEIWRKLAVEMTPYEGHHPDHGFASASPFTDGEYLFSHFGSRGLYCYDMDGQLKWKRDDFGKMQTKGGYGEGSTPVLHDSTIVVPWDQEGQSYVTALEKHSGKTKWKVDRDEPTSWVSPVVVEANGKKLVIVGGQNFTRGYDLESGTEIWRASGTSFRPTAGPVIIDNLVLVASNRRNHFLGALRFDGRGNLNKNGGVAWSQTNSAPDVPGLALSGDRVYYVKSNSNIFNCSDAKTGKPRFFNKRLEGIEGVYASPVVAGGKVIVVGRNGTSVVLQDSDQFNVIASNRLDDRIDATPALVGNEIILRGKKYLYCISESSP